MAEKYKKICDLAKGLKESSKNLEFKEYSRMAEKIEIQEKDFNLSINAYIRREVQKREINIEQLEQEIRVEVERINRLRVEIDELVKTLKK